MLQSKLLCQKLPACPALIAHLHNLKYPSACYYAIKTILKTEEVPKLILKKSFVTGYLLVDKNHVIFPFIYALTML